MAERKTSRSKSSNNGATVGYEAELWQMADALRGSMDAAEYKHVVLGLIFLKYISNWDVERLPDEKRWQNGMLPGSALRLHIGI